MKTLWNGLLLLGSLGLGSAMAADHSVGIVYAAGEGTALNVYSITGRGVSTVRGSPYVFPSTVPGVTNRPISVSVAPEHDLVYVVYERLYLGEPILVQFKITPRGLSYQWQEVIQSGDVGLQGGSISAVSNYVIEKTYPAEGLWVHILDRSGQEVVGDTGTDGTNLVSGHVDPEGKFYYSCRFLSSVPYGGVRGPANAVAIFKLEGNVAIESIPLFTSTDPVFVQSECN